MTCGVVNCLTICCICGIQISVTQFTSSTLLFFGREHYWALHWNNCSGIHYCPYRFECDDQSKPRLSLLEPVKQFFEKAELHILESIAFYWTTSLNNIVKNREQFLVPTIYFNIYARVVIYSGNCQFFFSLLTYVGTRFWFYFKKMAAVIRNFIRHNCVTDQKIKPQFHKFTKATWTVKFNRLCRLCHWVQSTE